MSKIVNEDKLNIDFQESRFGETLLSLAILNDKNLSIEQLLRLGANPNIKSTITGSSPFLDFCYFKSSYPTGAETLKMLIKYGGDVNAINTRKNSDTLVYKSKFIRSALIYVCESGNLASLKVMVENGAKLDIYPTEGEQSLITTVILNNHFDMLKYFLIEKQFKIPSWCFLKYPGDITEKKMTITDALIEYELPSNPERDKLKEEILVFLKSKQRK
jgi:ankyrin repeat protein